MATNPRRGSLSDARRSSISPHAPPRSVAGETHAGGAAFPNYAASHAGGGGGTVYSESVALEADSAAHLALVRLVAHADALTAELLRLARAVPWPLLGVQEANARAKEAEKKAQATQQPTDIAAARRAADGASEAVRLAPVLPDFSYLIAPELFDARAEEDLASRALDDELRAAEEEDSEGGEPASGEHVILRFASRVAALLLAIVRYQADLSAFFDELASGAYIQSTPEAMLQSPKARQLMAEAPARYGQLLLLLEVALPGPVRERCVVANVRHKGWDDAAMAGPSNSVLDGVDAMDRIVSLSRKTDVDVTALRRTGAPLPPDYIDSFFKRLPLDDAVIAMICARARAEDIYAQIQHWPEPEHRTSALANQAGVVFALLHLCPRILHSDYGAMREVVDKHFDGHWVVAWAPGYAFDLAWWWDAYPAAKAALANAVTTKRAVEMQAKHIASIPICRGQLKDLVDNGSLTDPERALSALQPTLNVIRAANHALRWLLLHDTIDGGPLSAKKLKESLFAKRPNPETVLSLLLELSYVEDIAMEVFGALVDERGERWASLRESVVSKITELAQFYLGDTPLTAKMKDEGLSSYFDGLAKAVGALELTEALVGESGRKIQSILNAIDDLMRFHQIESFLQTKQHLSDVKRLLQRMVLVANLQERNITTLINVSDVGYVFGNFQMYTQLMRGRVCRDPSSVGQLRCFFLKLSRSVVEPPLMRINECDSQDFTSVCEHYSGCVVNYVESVLVSVPEAMLDTLLEAAALARSVPALAEPPSRIERSKLRDFAVPDVRRKMAALSRRVAELAAGILHMETAFLGVIEIDPVKVLEEGLRENLRHKAHLAVDATLAFQGSAGFADEEGKSMAPVPYPPGRAAGAFGGEIGGGGGLGAGKKRAKAASERHVTVQQCLSNLKGRLDALTAAFALVFDYTGAGGPTAFDDALGDVLWSLSQKEVVAHISWRRARLTQLKRSALASGKGSSSSSSSKKGVTAIDTLVAEPSPPTSLGRLIIELLRLSDPFEFAYDPFRARWIPVVGASGEAMASSVEACEGSAASPPPLVPDGDGLSPPLLNLLSSTVGVQGVSALDRVVGTRVAGRVREALIAIDAFLPLDSGSRPVPAGQHAGASEVAQAVTSLSSTLSEAARGDARADAALTSLAGLAERIEKSPLACPSIMSLAGLIARIGQHQLLRVSLREMLCEEAALDGGAYGSALAALSDAFVSTTAEAHSTALHATDTATKTSLPTDVDVGLARPLADMLDASGLGSPFETVYVVAAEVARTSHGGSTASWCEGGIPGPVHAGRVADLLVLLTCVCCVPRYVQDPSHGILLVSSKDLSATGAACRSPPDAQALAAGVACLLRQLPRSYTTAYFDGAASIARLYWGANCHESSSSLSAAMTASAAAEASRATAFFGGSGASSKASKAQCAADVSEGIGFLPSQSQLVVSFLRSMCSCGVSARELSARFVIDGVGGVFS